MKKMMVKLNVNLLKHKKGEVLLLDCNSRGAPTEIFWRRRVADSEKDNCLTIMNKKPLAKNPKAKEVQAEKTQSEETKTEDAQSEKVSAVKKLK